jgi:hypothetical protein
MYRKIAERPSKPRDPWGNAMTQQEIENELKSLRAQEEARQRNWRSIRKTAAFSALAFILGGVGCLIFSVAYGGQHQTLQTAVMFILLSLPMSLIGAALR